MHSRDTPLADDRDVARNKVRCRLDIGGLPTMHSGVPWVGDGAGQTCCVCDETILTPHALYAIDWEQRAFPFHNHCYGLWLAELIRRGLYKPE